MRPMSPILQKAYIVKHDIRMSSQSMVVCLFICGLCILYAGDIIPNKKSHHMNEIGMYFRIAYELKIGMDWSPIVVRTGFNSGLDAD